MTGSEDDTAVRRLRDRRVRERSSPHSAGGGGERPGDSGEDERARLYDWAAVGIPTALAALLCCYDIAARSLGFDEGATATIAVQHGGALGRAIAHDGGNMSGYYLLLHVLTGVFGDSSLVLRLPSAVAAVVTVAVVCRLARMLFDRRVALVSGLLTAVSLPLVYWGQTARGYALMVAFVAASWLAFVTLVTRERPARWAWIAYVLAITLAVYASFVAVLVVPAQLLSLRRRPRALPRVASALVASALCCTPLAVLAVIRGSGQLFWVPRPSITAERQMIESLTSAALQPNFRPTATTLITLCVTVVVLVSVAVATTLRRRGRDLETAWEQTLVWSWLVVPVALAWVESLFGQPIFLPRNLLLAVPAVGLLLALGITDLRLPRFLAGALLVALIVLRTLQVTASYGISPEDWKAASAYILARSHQGDCIAFYPSDGRMAFRYYLGRGRTIRPPSAVLPSAPWSEVRTYVEDYASLSRSDGARLPARCPRLWFVSSHQGQANGPPGSRANYARYLQLVSRLENAYRLHRPRAFGYASPVRVELLAVAQPRSPAG